MQVSLACAALNNLSGSKVSEPNTGKAAWYRWKWRNGGRTMLGWTIVFLIVAIVAALLGFTGIAGTAVWIAKVIFVVFLILFVLSLVFRRRPPPA